MQHLDEGTVHAWLDGALSPEESAEVEAHVAGCADCAAMVADARGLIAGASRIVSALDSVRGDVVPRARAGATAGRDGSLWASMHLTPARAALAATIMIAAASIIAVRHNTPDKMVLEPGKLVAPVAAAPAPAAAAPAASPASAPAPKPRAAPAPSANLAMKTAVTDSGAQPSFAPQRRFSAESLKARDAGPGGMTLPRKRLQLNADARSAEGMAVAAVLVSSAGCYAIEPESAAVRAEVPPRFSLERGSAGRSNGVAPLSADGARQQVIDGSSWQEGPDGVIEVNLPHAVLHIDGVKGRLVGGADSTTVTLGRVACRP